MRCPTLKMFLLGLLATGCLQKKPATAEEASASNDNSDGTADKNAALKSPAEDKADRPSPITGAYLTCILTKSPTPGSVDAGCQVRSSDRKRIADSVVRTGKWSYTLPANVKKDGFKVSMVRLTDLGPHYYFHLAVHITPRSSSTLNLVDSNTPSAETAHFAASLSGIYSSAAGKGVQSNPLLKATHSATSLASPDSVPGAVTQSNESFEPNKKGVVIAPPPDYTNAIELPTYSGNPQSLPPPPALPQDSSLGPSPSASPIPTATDVTTEFASVYEPIQKDDTENWPLSTAGVEPAPDTVVDPDSSLVIDTNLDSDHDGIPDYQDRCPNTDPERVAEVVRDLTSENNGCAPGEKGWTPMVETVSPPFQVGPTASPAAGP